MQTIYLDIANKGVVPTIYAKQGDVGRKFQVVLTDSGVPYSPPVGSVFSVWYEGDSGDGNYTDVGDKTAFSVSANKVTVELITQMLAVAGEGLLCLVLNGADGSQIASWNIDYLVESVPGANSEQAEDYYTAFSRAVETLPYPDASLSTPGKAADAAATGAALAGKAPAGYGLGTESVEVSDLNTITKTGFYRILGGTANKPEHISYGTILHRTRDSDEMTQEALDIYGTAAKRYLAGGVWSEWEYVNPPMVIGVEYRTTERYAGKAVYTRLLNLGSVAGTKVTIEANHGINGRIISATATAGYFIATGIPSVGLGTGDAMTVFTDTQKVYVNTFGAWSGNLECYALLKYIKN